MTQADCKEHGAINCTHPDHTVRELAAEVERLKKLYELRGTILAERGELNDSLRDRVREAEEIIRRFKVVTRPHVPKGIGTIYDDADAWLEKAKGV